MWQFLEASVDPLNNNITKTPIDITGYDFTLQARVNISDTGLPAFELSVTNGRITLIEPLNGKIELKVTDEDTGTTEFPVGTYVYDLQQEDLSGNKKLLISGNIIVRESVTRT